MKYRPEIDGLRTVAVLPVILFHAGFSIFSGGFVGVDVFFVISGFLITGILAGELAEGRFSLLRFYERRARRILPALFVVMLACLPFAWMWMTPDAFQDFSQSLVAVGVFASNILFWRESGYFEAAAEEKPLLHTWSLAVEEQYYLLFPLLLWGLWRTGHRPVFILVLVLSVISLSLSEWGWRRMPDANFYLAPFRAWELFAGSLCALWCTRHPPVAHQGLSLLGLGLIVMSIFVYDATVPFPSLWALAPVGGTALILLYGMPGTWAARLLSLRPMVGIGLISYSAYLWHQPLFAFARIRTLGEPEHWIMGGLAVLSLGLAYLTWRFVEQPFRQRPKPWLAGRPALFGASAAGIAAFMAFGVMGHVTKGFEGRMPAVYFDRMAELSANKAARQTQIRAGLCHFNHSGQHRDLDSFLDNWACGFDSDPTRKALPLALYGDSHAADKVMALRLNGRNITQMGGANCPLLPVALPYYCQALLDRVHAEAEASGITTIVLANRFTAEELTPAYLSEVAAYWSARYARVVLFSPMPTWHKLEKTYAKAGANGLGAQKPDLDKADRFFEALRTVVLPKQVQIIDTQALFCETRPGCAAIDGRGLLLVDHEHLSLAGATLFGADLAEQLTALPDG